MLSKAPVAATLPYSGLKTAVAFYEKKLGFKRIAGSPSEGYLEYALGGGTTLNVFESDTEKCEDTAATFEVDDLEKEMSELRKKRVVFEEYDLPNGIKTVRGVATMDGHKGAWFKDPGGNILALHQAVSSRGNRKAVKAAVR
jgi:catechol 2,3-dioxygenase-like lactoylglutathione lyase family enzyme